MGVSCRSTGRAFQGCGFRLRTNAGVCFRAFFQNALTLSIPHTVGSHASRGAASGPAHCRLAGKRRGCKQSLTRAGKKIICLLVVSAGCRVLLCKTRVYFFPRKEMCSQASISCSRRHVGFCPPGITNTYTINPRKRPQSQGFC